MIFKMLIPCYDGVYEEDQNVAKYAIRNGSLANIIKNML